MPYEGIIACGLDQNWEWITFPLSLLLLSYVQEFIVESTTFSSPLFVCTNNAATMKAAFDGSFDIDIEIIRSGCTEHRLSTCINDSFRRGVNFELNQFMDQLLFIETYYKTRQAKASQLPFSVPTKSKTSKWRSYYRRFNAHLKIAHIIVRKMVRNF